MKRAILFAAVFVLCTARSQAQGQITFANNASTLVTTPELPQFPAGTQVELFYLAGGPVAPAPIFNWTTGLLNFGAWEVASGSNPLTLNAAFNGRFSAGIVTTGNDVAPNANVWLTVLGWTGGAATFQDAYISGFALLGESTIFELVAGGPAPFTPANLTAMPVSGQAFSGVVLGSPEPSMIAIGALGGAVLFHFRRQGNFRGNN